MEATSEQRTAFQPAEFDILIHWMLERDRIRALKESGAQKPWTADSLLRDYRWCNVRRMDDKVSRWLLSDWYPAFHEPKVQLLAAVAARLINWPDALDAVRDVFPHIGEVRTRLHSRKRAGEKIFTGAYVVPGVPNKEKIDSVLEVVATIEPFAAEIVASGSMQATWQRLIDFDGLGSFLAGQVVSDLAFLDVGGQWTDRHHWAPVGPGSARGINRLRGIAKDKPVRQAEFDRLLPALCALVRERVSDLWVDRALIAMDIQNSLCEFDKYRRLTLAEGSVRARYNGGSDGQMGLI